MSHNINDIKSQHELNDGKRKSDVLIEAIEKCEKLEKDNKILEEKLDIAVKLLDSMDIQLDFYLDEPNAERDFSKSRLWQFRKPIKEVLAKIKEIK